MQSTLTLQEEELARSLKAQGRSTQDIMGAIAKQRTGGIDKAQSQQSQSMSGSTLGRVATDVPSDFMELGRNVRGNVNAGSDKLTGAMQDPSANPVQKAASVLPILGQSVLNVAGGAAVDIGKMLTTDEFEKAVSSKIGEAGSAVMDTSAAKGLAAWYDRQDDATKFNIRNIFLPVGEVVGEVATAGVGAGATRAASGAISRGVANAGEELTSLAGDIARPPVTAPIQTPLPPEVKATIVKGFDVAIKPNLSSKQTPVQLGRYNEQVARSIDTITNNRANLSYVDDATGETVTGRLPENLKEYVEALEQTKQTIFQQYDDIAAKAGEVGAQVDTIAVANQLDEILNSKSLKLSNPEAIRYAEEVRGRLLSTRNLSTVDAQDVIRNYNKSLEAFYRNPTPEGLTRNAVDAMVANNLRKALDDEIAGITGAQYQALKSDYASLKTVERDIMRAFNRDARRNTKGLIDFTDVLTGGQVVSGILSMNPAIIGQGLAGKAVSTAIKIVNDPNRKVKQIFQEAGRYERPDAGANTPTRRQLPAAQPNAPRSEISGGRTVEVGGQTERGQVTTGITERTRDGAIRQPDGEKEIELGKSKPATTQTTLLEEAKGFDTADAFVKSKGEPLFHGTDKEFDVFDTSKSGTTQGLDKDALFFTTNKDTAKAFSADFPQKSKFRFTEEDKALAQRAEDTVKEVRLNTTDSLTLDDVVKLFEEGKIKTKPKTEGLFRAESFYDNNRKAIKEAVDVTGKKVFKARAEGQTQYAVFDDSLIKTKAQLTDIWKQANKKPTLLEEAKLKKISSSNDETFYEIISDGKKVGELETLENYYGEGDLHIQFIGVDEAGRGKGVATSILNRIAEQSDSVTLSAEPTNKIAYNALKKAYGEPIEIGNDIRELTEDELLKVLPDTAQYNSAGELDSSSRGFVRWNNPNQ